VYLSAYSADALESVSTVTTIQKSKRTTTLRALTEVPPFPAVAIKTLRVISNEFGQLRDLSDLITTDAAISGQILRMANSSLFGFRTEIKSIFHAIHVLGLERLKGVVATIAMKSYLGTSLEVPALRACWRHSLACAVLAEKLAGPTSLGTDIAYTAGLLHDIGRLALVAGYPREYAGFLASTETESCDTLDRERELFGIDHCEAGLLLVSRWKLPVTFISVTSRHHDDPIIGESAALTIVRRSCMMADALGFNAVHFLQPRDYQEILGVLPEVNRSELPREPAELIQYVENKIDSIERT
jgi:putative nucleotidyltransferase with HDIG domain